MSACPYCGQNNAPDSNACSFCGYALTAKAAPELEEITPEQPSGENSPRRKRKGLKLLAIAASAVILLCAGLGIAFARGPFARVASAAEKTVKALETTLGGTEALASYLEATTKLQASQYTATNAVMTIEGQTELELQLSGILSPKDGAMDAALRLGLVDGAGLDMGMYADKTAMYFHLPQLLEDKLFMGSYESLAELLNEGSDTSFTAEDIDPFNTMEFAQSTELQESTAALGDAFFQLVKNAKIQKVMNFTPADASWDAYVLELPSQEREALAKALGDYFTLWEEKVYPDNTFPTTEELQDQLSLMNDPIVCINDDGYLSQFLFTMDESTIELVLEGEENPWTSFLVRLDGTEALQVTMEPQGGKTDITLLSQGEELLGVEYESSTGSFFLETAEGLSMELSLCAKDDKAIVEMAMDLDELSFSLSSTTEASVDAPELPRSNKVYDLFNMTEEEGTEVAMELVTALYTNRELMELLGQLGLGAGIS